MSPPNYKHDCSRCKFLGLSADGEADLYLCPKQDSDVIARLSSEPSDYQSSCVSTLVRNFAHNSSFLKQAYHLASEVGLIEGEVRADISDLGLAEITYCGISFKTAEPVKFYFMRNTESSQQFNIDPSLYQQDIEPAGRYLVFDETPDNAKLPGWVSGEIRFNSPLVLGWNSSDEGGYDDTSWKARLYRFCGAKTDADLSKMLRHTYGFDGIITVRGDEISEIVDLKMW